MTSDLVTYHHRSPDPLVAGCMNSRAEGTDGVVFNGIEPMEGAFCFVGRQSIVEAMAALYNTTPADVLARMDTEPPAPKRGPGRPKKGVNGED